MTREIKFRVWDTKRLGMFESEFHITSYGKVLWWDESTNGYVDFRDDIILMQYTGLKDKNGKEIYEGDILKWIGENELENQSIVDWSTFSDDEYVSGLECWMVDYSPLSCLVKSGGVRFNRGSSAKDGTVEIIGNIYENPDLIK